MIKTVLRKKEVYLQRHADFCGFKADLISLQRYCLKKNVKTSADCVIKILMNTFLNFNTVL